MPGTPRRSGQVVLPALVALVVPLLLGGLGALAQAEPVRVVQGSDGTLYVLVDGVRHLLVPDVLSDEELHALPEGEPYYGTLPAPTPVVLVLEPTPVLISEPTPSPRYIGQDLQVIVQAHNPRPFANVNWYALVLENPNTNLGTGPLGYTAMAYDASGNLIGSETNTFPPLAPGQRLGKTSYVSIPRHATIARLEIRLDRPEFRLAARQIPLVVDDVTVVESGRSVFYDTWTWTSYTAVIKNPMGTEFRCVEVYPVGYDAGGGIVGAPPRKVNSLPPFGRSTISIALDSPQPLARVELYPVALC